MKKRTACFFSNESKEQLLKEQYSLQDINILEDLGFSVTIATSFSEIPWNCDLYFSWWASGSIIPLVKAKLSRSPIIIVAGGNEAMLYHDSVSKKPIGYLATPWYKKLATKLCLRFGTTILAVSKFMTNDIQKIGTCTPLVVHNSVDTNSFTFSNTSREFVTTIFKSDETIVNVKRGEVFIRSIPFVLNEFPNQKFIIIGGKGNATGRLQQLVSKLEISKNIEFLGAIDNIEVVKWLQKTKVYVQISDTETFGVAIAEAMSCGTPVVVSKRGAIPEVVSNYGTYVDHNDPQAVAFGIINTIKKEKGELYQQVHRARERIKNNFSYEKRKSKLSLIINDILV